MEKHSKDMYLVNDDNYNCYYLSTERPYWDKYSFRPGWKLGCAHINISPDNPILKLFPIVDPGKYIKVNVTVEEMNDD